MRAVDRGGDSSLTARPLCDVSDNPLTFDLNIAWVRDRETHPVVREFTRDLSRFTLPLREGWTALTP